MTQTPFAWAHITDDGNIRMWAKSSPESIEAAIGVKPIALYTEPPTPSPPWIDPNDKTQKQFLPHIGEPVLFCHQGKTYCGKHSGGSFTIGSGLFTKFFNTWECRWMHLPDAFQEKEPAP